MANQFATPATAQAQIQAWLNAQDTVFLADGSVYPIIVDSQSNGAFGLQVPGGAVLDLNGATLLFSGIQNQVLAQDRASLVGRAGGTCGIIRNGTVRGPASRVVPGQLAAGNTNLMYFDAHGVAMAGLVDNVTLHDGLTQALQLNNVNGMTLRRLRTPRPAIADPYGRGGHYVDLDVTANGRYTEAIEFDDCDLDAFGSNAVRLENVRNIRLRNTRFRNYVSLVQDEYPYSSLEDVEFDAQCVFYSYVGLQNLRRRWSGGYYDNLGGGRVTLRGRMVGEDALILGHLNTPLVFSTNSHQFTNLKCEFMAFEGPNSHLVPLPDSSWITQSTGVKQRVTIYARPNSMPQYPFGVTPCVVAGAVGDNNTLSSAVQISLVPTYVSVYGLAKRGVRVSVAARTWTGQGNQQSWPSVNQNVPIDFIGEGGSAATIIDVQDANLAGLVVSGTNNRLVRFFGFTLRRAKGGSSSRGWLVNSAAANVEFYDVISDDCNCSNGGAGGRAQNYARLVLGPGTYATRCQATDTSHGGGFLIDQAGTAPSQVEGVGARDCSAAGSGGGLRINSPYCKVRSLELINNLALNGAGGLYVRFLTSGVAMGVFGLSGRGNAGSTGQASDVAVHVGSAASRVVLRSAVLGSASMAPGGSLVMAKDGPGNFDYADINSGVFGTFTLAGGVNTDLGGHQRSDPQFVADTTSVVLSSTSPARAAAVPQWQVGVERAPAGAQGEWFQISKSGKTTMGARP